MGAILQSLLRFVLNLLQGYEQVTYYYGPIIDVLVIITGLVVYPLWTLYYVRSVRVRTYMGSDAYLRLAFFTKKVKGPIPAVPDGSEILLETERLYLRRFTLADAENDYLYSQEESRKKGIPNEVYKNRSTAWKHVQAILSWYANGDYPYVYAIALKDSGEYIGHVGLSRIAEGIEIGFAICEKHQGKGYATEAVQAYVTWGKQALGLEKIYGLAYPDNAASQRVLQKAGFALAEDITNPHFTVYVA